MKALVLAGGRGTRLRPITTTLNKHLIPIASRPMIFRVLDDIADCGIKEVIVNLNKGDKEVPAAIGDGSNWGLKVHYIEQEIPNGMMYPILMAQELLGDEPFLLFAGDNILSGGIKKYYDEFMNGDSDVHVLATKIKDPQRYGVAVVENGVVTKIVEKPQEFISDLAVTAIYFFRKPIIEAMKNVEPEVKGNSSIAEYYPPPAVQWLIDRGHKVTATEVTGWWKDTGKPEALLEGNGLVLESIESKILGNVSDAAQIQGRIQIGEGSTIGDNVVLRGPITIGRDCKLENCYIGPYTSIGSRVSISNAQVQNSILLDDVMIDCKRQIVDSIIGSQAIVKDNSETFPSGHKLIIGDNTLVEL